MRYSTFVGVAVLASLTAAAVTTPLVNDSPACKVVDLDNARHARILDHAHDAIDRGLPERLTIDRRGAAENRRLSLRGVPTRAGFDRDEYPPASSAEGGAGASVRYIGSSENRSAGALLGRELRGLPEGGCFHYEEGGRDEL